MSTDKELNQDSPEKVEHLGPAEIIIGEGQIFNVENVVKNNGDIQTFQFTVDVKDLKGYLLFMLHTFINREETGPDQKEDILETYNFIKDNIEELKFKPRTEEEAQGLKFGGELTWSPGDLPEEIVSKHFNKYYVSFLLATLYRHGDSEALIFEELEAPTKGKNKRPQRIDNNTLVQMSIHAITQFYKPSKEPTLFSVDIIDNFSKETGLKINNRPESYGVVLNDNQKRVFEGILKAFSDTNYQGDIKVETMESLEDTYNVESGKARARIKSPYQNIDKIPVRRLSQADIVRLSGYNMDSQGEKENVVQAIDFLATNQFCFYWIRLAKDDKGRPLKEKSGDWKKEEVMEVGTLFRIKTVRDPATNILQYYEIHPSAVILDQVNSNYGGNYFLLVPHHWRQEVKKIIGKNVSRYTLEFLFWLRLQYEIIRRQNTMIAKKKKGTKKKRPFTIEITWEEVAQTIKMPETIYRKNRKRARGLIEDAYSSAIKLGYLHKKESNEVTDILFLNESFYPKPGEFEEEVKQLQESGEARK